MPKYVTDKALFNVSLRNACLGIAIFFLVTLVLGVIVRPGYLHSSSSLIGFIVELISNLALLFGALWSNAWLVLVWLVVAVLFFIHWPIAVLGVIFNYGDYRAAAYFNNVFLILFEYILALVIFGYCAYLVYSYFHQLRNSQSATPHDVVV
ncbi:uncharacterized protein LOC129246412 [Anastrepha obliqua]|uniref:uncharacterized protein LOC128867464 n=1 Tax=Anastrepha ludens TaxID=28586 RepID=UPI0023AF52AD|nr:uncharacterized protein LOC128867464 [Anastrepha ludens]XP_053964648.1 uncharacterized protein LOC128867464 [Anastrepha ludens]XP_054741195.1 uncharacterized protein LOC129246412 [Anastrepha obliqua]